jgi:hypothetical protein
MATQVQKLENRFPQRLLQADGIYELILGAGLLIDSASIARWFGISAAELPLVGVAVLAYGAWMLYMSQRNFSRQIFQGIAVLNVAFSILGIVVLALDWNTFANEGRWLITLVADAGLILGLLELYAQRFMA